jgi:hypothetical protein
MRDASASPWSRRPRQPAVLTDLILRYPEWPNSLSDEIPEFYSQVLCCNVGTASWLGRWQPVPYTLEKQLRPSDKVTRLHNKPGPSRLTISVGDTLIVQSLRMARSRVGLYRE